MAGSQQIPHSDTLRDPILTARLDALRALAERTSDRIMVVDHNQTIVYANRAAWRESAIPQSNAPTKCYEAFLNRTDPCSQCPAEEVFKTNEVRTVSCMVGGEGLSCGMHQAFPLMGEEGTTESVLVLFSPLKGSPDQVTSTVSSVTTGRSEISMGPHSLGDLIGVSHRMKQVFDLVQMVSDSQATVLILGESGTGKELVARTIHHLSDRKHQPFVVVDCGALPEPLLESELFGHVKGAYTGAHVSKRGLLEEADGGTIFLDEIGDASLSFQSKLLRVLQEGEIKPVGSNRSLKINVRFISATNKDLSEQIQVNSFREDLYYRISVLPLLLPPLRERPEDIPYLVEHFVANASKLNNRPIRPVSGAALTALAEASWPGNVRELQHLIERVVVTSTGEILNKDDFFPVNEDESTSENLHILSRQVKHRVEREKIITALQKTEGNRAQAARLLGISRASLYNKLRTHRIR